jgi:hypothetical protein
MIAHNRQSLDNLDTQQEAAEALAKTVITQAEYDRIREACPFKLYSPNIFIRIGLFLLTVLAVACGLGLFMLMTLSGGEHAIGFILIFWGLAAYGGLELFIRSRGVYQAGVDDALLWLGGGLVFGGINLLATNISPILESWMVLVLAGWGVLRYADRLMALVAYGALISVIFHLTNAFGSFGSAILPFVIMALSVIAYLLFTRLSTDESLRHYHTCLLLLRMTALLSFYLSGNYFVVQHINASLHGEAAPVALSWLWWTYTLIVPVAYVVTGIRKKDTILLWTGLGLVAGAVFTIRHYYHILPTELAMIAGGIILIVGAWGLIRYLHTPKHGFTSIASDEPHLLENLPVESLILAETFKSVPAQPADQSGRFGGGSGGGAGAGGTY